MKALKNLADEVGITPREERERAAQAQVLDIGTAIREARLRKDWSQSDLAAQSAVPQPEISRIENGAFQQGPTAMTLCRLAQALDLRISMEPMHAEGHAVGERDEQTDASETPETARLRYVVREELAAAGLTGRQRSGRRRVGGVEVRYVPIVTKYLDETVHSDLEKLAEDLSRSIEQNK